MPAGKVSEVFLPQSWSTMAPATATHMPASVSVKVLLTVYRGLYGDQSCAQKNCAAPQQPCYREVCHIVHPLA